MFKLQELIRKNMVGDFSLQHTSFLFPIWVILIWRLGLLVQDKLALSITTEQGKTLKDAQGDVFRGLG